MRKLNCSYNILQKALPQISSENFFFMFFFRLGVFVILLSSVDTNVSYTSLNRIVERCSILGVYRLFHPFPFDSSRPCKKYIFSLNPRRYTQLKIKKTTKNRIFHTYIRKFVYVVINAKEKEEEKKRKSRVPITQYARVI